MTISFDVSKADSATIQNIVARSCNEGLIKTAQAHELTMDITACHANGTPLRLADLLKAPLADFGHDLLGINRYVSRTTGELTKNFQPRCAART